MYVVCCERAKRNINRSEIPVLKATSFPCLRVGQYLIRKLYLYYVLAKLWVTKVMFEPNSRRKATANLGVNDFVDLLTEEEAANEIDA